MIFFLRLGSLSESEKNMTNIELLVFAALSGGFTLGLFGADSIEMRLISGALAFIGWWLTALYYMSTNPGLIHFGLFFGLLGTVCLIFVIAWGIVILDPERKLKLLQEGPQ